jgi:tripartite-type tricarboxylate transporter receptor subunit TctC
MQLTRRLIPVVLVAGLALAGCGASSSPTETTAADAASWQPVFKNGVLQPLPDGFPKKGKRLTLLNLDDAGSADGLYARSMQKALGAVSPVDVQVLDKPGADNGTWEGLKFMESQGDANDGYSAEVVAFTGAGLDFLTGPITKQYGYTVESMNPVIATEKVPFVMIMRGNSSYNSYDDLVAAAKASPGKLKYISASVGSQLDIAMTSLMQQQGWTAKKIPLKSGTLATTTIAAGGGDFGMALPDVVVGQFKAGKVKVPLVVGDTAAAPFDAATTTKALGLEEPWGSMRGFMASSKVPDLHRRWLYELFKAGTQQQAYKDRIAGLPGSVSLQNDHDAVLTVIKNAMTVGEPILGKLGLLNKE